MLLDYAIDVVFLKYLRAETAQLIDNAMSKRPREDADVQAGWDEDASSDEDSVWDASDDEMDDATRAAYRCINKHSRENYALEMQTYCRWLIRDGKRSFVDESLQVMQPKFPLVPEHIMKYFSWLECRKVAWRHHSNPQQKKRLAPTTIVGIACAFKDFYRINLSEVPLELTRFFSNRNRAYVLKISLEKMQGQYPTDRSSMGLSTAAFGRLLRCSIELRPIGHKFSFSVIRHHPLFFKLSSILCGRGERVVKIQYSFIGVWADAFRCKIPNSKSDQEGLMSYWKLFYANTLDPFWCPILELAIHCACNTLCDDFEFVFPQSYRGAFRDYFDDFKKNVAEEDVEFIEILRHQLTLHSLKRTGVMMANSCEAVHWDQAELRADHKIGMNATYMSGAQPDQDAIMGRVLSNLPFGTNEFESQMPHFEESVAGSLPMREIFAGYDKYPANFRAVMPFLVASLVYHQKHIQQHYHGHPVCSSPLFTTRKHILKDLEPKLFGGRYVRSVLPLTGRSYLGATFAKVQNMEVKLTEIHGIVCGNAGTENGVAFSSDITRRSFSASSFQPTIADRADREVSQVNDKLKLLVGRMESFFPAPSAKTKFWPVGYVPASFRVPPGLLVADCFRFRRVSMSFLFVDTYIQALGEWMAFFSRQGLASSR